MMNSRPTIHPDLLSQFLDPAQRLAIEAEYVAWQAEIAAHEQEERAAEQAKLERKAQRIRALLGPTGEVVPHIPIKPSRHRQEPSEIDKELAIERRRRASHRTASRHAPAAPQPEPKPWSAQDAFSIAGEKRRKKVETGPRARPGDGRRRREEHQLRWMADVARAGRRVDKGK